MSLIIMLEKIKFILEEMEIAHHLAKSATDDESARVLSRHVVVRAENLIVHARNIRKPLFVEGYEVKKFHDVKEIYASDFESYFSKTRHKLGAHIQDLDFYERIKIWNEIENLKIDYFANDAISIYKELEDLCIPNFVNYSRPSEIDSPDFIEAITNFRKNKVPRSSYEIGTDPLAISRNNTSAVMNYSDIHVRAGQINLLRRWIKYQNTLVEHFKGFKSVERILKERIITDVVSFCDCLVTREVRKNALQEMDGLDRLLVKTGYSAHTINLFLKVYNFKNKLDKMRDVRDKIGAHIHKDTSVSLSYLLEKLDNIHFSEILAFYEKVENIFIKTCSEVFILNFHLSDGEYIVGNLSNSSISVPYGDIDYHNESNEYTEEKYNCEKIYEKNYEKWKSCDPVLKNEGGYYFFQAFSAADVVETIEEEEKTDPHPRLYHYIEIRTSHQFILKKLKLASDTEVLKYLFPLLISCSTGDCKALTKVVLKFAENSNRKNLRLDLLNLIGTIGYWENKKAKDYIKNNILNKKYGLEKLIAKLALFKIFVKSEGLNRINKNRLIRDYEEEIGWMSIGISDVDKLIMNIIFLSNIYGYYYVGYIDYFSVEINYLKDGVKEILRKFLGNARFSQLEYTVSELFETRDYVGLSLMIIEELKDNNLEELFLNLTCTGVIVTANHDQARRHLVGCHLRNDNMEIALNLAKDIAERNPHLVDYQMLYIQVLVLFPNLKEKAKEEFYNIQENYKNMVDREQDVLLGIEVSLFDN